MQYIIARPITWREREQNYYFHTQAKIHDIYLDGAVHWSREESSLLYSQAGHTALVPNQRLRTSHVLQVPYLNHKTATPYMKKFKH